VKITHIITGLSADGAETMLYGLLRSLDAQLYTNEVICLTRRGAMAERIESLGIPVRALNMSPGIPNPLLLASLTSSIRKSRPDIVQTWMYHSDLLGGVCARLAGQPNVVWNIRHNRPSLATDKYYTVLTARMCARASKWLPVKIVCCSKEARDAHVSLGYVSSKFEIIPNGIDVERFRPDPNAARVLRQQLGVPQYSPMIGVIARFHPVKGHRTFIEAAGKLHTLRPDVHFVLCGGQVDRNNEELVTQIRNAGIDSCCDLLGIKQDVAPIVAALDIATSASLSESFPNVVAEAMACGVPCVVTDVGGSRALVGNTGKVVPPKDPKAIVKAWQELLDMGPEGRRELGATARQRIENHFSLGACVRRYEELYQSVVRASPRGLEAGSTHGMPVSQA
jgi:glycosyltransferase involved in cell wall biosynthesis